jgi:DNA-directed RNA polymerase specialized sigma54-like protein
MIQQCNNYSENRLIKIISDNNETYDANVKIVNRHVYHVKERKINMAIVKTMVTLEHPSIIPLKYFFMSPNQFYFITSASNSGTLEQNVFESLLANEDCSKPLSHNSIKAVIKDLLMSL